VSAHLQRVAEIVLRESGIRVRSAQLPALEATLQRVERGMGAEAFVTTLGDPECGPALIERLIEAVTVKETYFLRNRGELDVIDWPARLAAAIAAGSEVVRVWNPACATGEESYTLAMLASEALGRTAPVSILATDIAPRALARAEEGSYGLRALRNVGAISRERHFRSRGERLTVAAGLRGQVQFATHNLVRDPIPPGGQGPFDVIVCRNVLIYFDPAAAADTADSLLASLAPGGMLVLGAADALTVTTGRAATPTAIPKPHANGKQRRPQSRRRKADSEPRQPVGPRPARALDVRGGDQNADGEGDLSATLARTDSMLAADALDPIAHFLRGLAERARDDAPAAIASFRRSLYADPGFARCAFELGRTHEALGDVVAARRSYFRALNALEVGTTGHQLKASAPADLATGCRARLQALHGEALP